MQIRQEGETITAAPRRRENFQSMDLYAIGSRRHAVCRRADDTAGCRQDRDFPTRMRRTVDARIDRPRLKTNRGKPAKFATRKKGPQVGKHVQPFAMSAAALPRLRERRQSAAAPSRVDASPVKRNRPRHERPRMDVRIDAAARLASDADKRYFRFFRNACPAAVIETLPRPFVG